jgi:hypothetical protein
MIRYEINLVAFTRPTGGSFSGINERVICFDYIGREDIIIYIYREREREREEDQIVCVWLLSRKRDGRVNKRLTTRVITSKTKSPSFSNCTYGLKITKYLFVRNSL